MEKKFISIVLQENLVTQVTVAEDFRELLADKMPDLAEKYLRLKRSLLENAFADFVNFFNIFFSALTLN